MLGKRQPRPELIVINRNFTISPYTKDQMLIIAGRMGYNLANIYVPSAGVVDNSRSLYEPPTVFQQSIITPAITFQPSPAPVQQQLPPQSAPFRQVVAPPAFASQVPTSQSFVSSAPVAAPGVTIVPEQVYYSSLQNSATPTPQQVYYSSPQNSATSAPGSRSSATIGAFLPLAGQVLASTAPSVGATLANATPSLVTAASSLSPTAGSFIGSLGGTAAQPLQSQPLFVNPAYANAINPTTFGPPGSPIHQPAPLVGL